MREKKEERILFLSRYPWTQHLGPLLLHFAKFPLNHGFAENWDQRFARNLKESKRAGMIPNTLTSSLVDGPVAIAVLASPCLRSYPLCTTILD